MAAVTERLDDRLDDSERRNADRRTWLGSLEALQLGGQRQHHVRVQRGVVAEAAQ